MTIIEAYFTLMEFPEHSFSFVAKQFLYFINLFNTNNDINRDSNGKFDRNRVFLDLKGVITILNNAWGFWCDNANDTGDLVNLLKAAVERWLGGLEGLKKIETYLEIFNMAFGLNKTEKFDYFFLIFFNFFQFFSIFFNFCHFFSIFFNFFSIFFIFVQFCSIFFYFYLFFSIFQLFNFFQFFSYVVILPVK